MLPTRIDTRKLIHFAGKAAMPAAITMEPNTILNPVNELVNHNFNASGPARFGAQAE